MTCELFLTTTKRSIYSERCCCCPTNHSERYWIFILTLVQ